MAKNQKSFAKENASSKSGIHPPTKKPQGGIFTLSDMTMKKFFKRDKQTLSENRATDSSLNTCNKLKILCQQSIEKRIKREPDDCQMDNSSGIGYTTEKKKMKRFENVSSTETKKRKQTHQRDESNHHNYTTTNYQNTEPLAKRTKITI